MGRQGIRYAKNRRTKQEQRPSSLGLCLARRRKTEGQISQNLNENLAEHEVVTETVTGLPLTAYCLQEGDTLKVERVTDRTKFQVSSSKFQDSRVAAEVKIVERTDTVYVAVRDSILVKSEELRVKSSLNPRPSTLYPTLQCVSRTLGEGIVFMCVGKRTKKGTW